MQPWSSCATCAACCRTSRPAAACTPRHRRLGVNAAGRTARTASWGRGAAARRVTEAPTGLIAVTSLRAGHAAMTAAARPAAWRTIARRAAPPVNVWRKRVARRAALTPHGRRAVMTAAAQRARPRASAAGAARTAAARRGALTPIGRPAAMTAAGRRGATPPIVRRVLRTPAPRLRAGAAAQSADGQASAADRRPQVGAPCAFAAGNQRHERSRPAAIYHRH